MKKVFLALLAVLAIVLTGCKFENANVTVYVGDKDGYPVAGRYVFYTDKASAILDVVLPASPEELAGLEYDDVWDYEKTDRLGIAEFKILMGVAKMNYYFVVYDEGKKDWVTKEVTLKRGENEEIEFEVTK